MPPAPPHTRRNPSRGRSAMPTTPDRSTNPISRRIDAVRTFNRFYTRRIGALSEGLLHTEFTLTESRLLWDLAHVETVTASELAHRLDLDPVYLSRLLRGFGRRGLIKRSRSKADGREVLLSLTAA